MFFPVVRFIVEGNSMAPTFRPGEHLLINKFIYKIKNPKKGDIIALSDPRDKNRILLKRILEVEDDMVNVISDNVGEGTDSRVFGKINTKNIIGKVFFRY